MPFWVNHMQAWQRQSKVFSGNKRQSRAGLLKRHQVLRNFQGCPNHGPGTRDHWPQKGNPPPKIPLLPAPPRNPVRSSIAGQFSFSHSSQTFFIFNSSSSVVIVLFLEKKKKKKKPPLYASIAGRKYVPPPHEIDISPREYTPFEPPGSTFFAFERNQIDIRKLN